MNARETQPEARMSLVELASWRATDAIYMRAKKVEDEIRVEIYAADGTYLWFVVGAEDPICPVPNPKRLYDAAPDDAKRLEPVFVVDHATHGDCHRVAPTEFATRLRRFVKECGFAVFGLQPRKQRKLPVLNQIPEYTLGERL